MATVKIITLKKKELKRLYIKDKRKKNLNVTLIEEEIHGAAYDLTHLDNLK